MPSIYLDNNASTPMLPEAWDAMRPFLSDIPGNPSSSHRAGRQARQALESSRELTATLLGAHPSEVVFTSGATEANNLALFGLIGEPLGHLVVSHIEHPCVIEPLVQLGKRGCELEWMKVNSEGVVTVESAMACVRADTSLVALMLANHETGAIQPVSQLVDNLPSQTRVHCDAAAAAGKIAIDFHALRAASLTISARKFHGSKGVGALLSRGIKLRPLLYGGHQQQGRRPGTEPVALAVGLATALECAMRELEVRRRHVVNLRKTFLEYLRKNAGTIVVNGPEAGLIPHTLNISFPGCQADVLLMKLDLAGVCCSTGSACSSGSLLPSPVLQAMNVSADRLKSAMRFSFSHLLSEDEVLRAAQIVSQVSGERSGGLDQ